MFKRCFFIAYFLGLSIFFTPGNVCAQSSREAILISHVENSILRAERNESKLSPAVISLPGMSSSKIRHFLNNICSMPGTSYLEIGVYKGSTFISALYRNESRIQNAIAIDNWSEFEGPKLEFDANCMKFLTGRNHKFYSADSFSLDKGAIFSKPVNVYFYDGNHSELSQELALTYYDDVLDDLFVLIVDDYNWEWVEAGTIKGLQKMNYEVLFSRHLPARFNQDTENWWNGLYVAVISKKN